MQYKYIPNVKNNTAVIKVVGECFLGKIFKLTIYINICNEYNLQYVFAKDM